MPLSDLRLWHAHLDPVIERMTEEISAAPIETLERWLREKIREDSQEMRRKYPALYAAIDAERRLKE